MDKYPPTITSADRPKNDGRSIVHRDGAIQQGFSVTNMMETGALLRRRCLDEKIAIGVKDDGRGAFVELIVQLAEHTPGLDAPHMMDGGPFMYGRWTVCLTYEPKLAPDCVILHMDVGPLPTSERDAVSVPVSLLESNHESCLQRRGFSISTLTGHIVYSEALALEGFGIDDLRVALERIAQHVARLVS
ncbi:hypothetical protein [Burkholderia ubonensis]|uniref:hypothetical protein n=1 Tax=Burkholderia ubonensis TaxID=101571 RepID=UPI000A3E4B9F|nr:hypothetical protein [Burkholderia ubonensis]